MMTVEKAEIENIAKLARIRINEDDMPEVAQRLNAILAMVDQMQAINTDNIEPMANPLDATQRLRADIVTQDNQREPFQAIAPQAEAGLYLVPKVID